MSVNYEEESTFFETPKSNKEVFLKKTELSKQKKKVRISEEVKILYVQSFKKYNKLRLPEKEGIKENVNEKKEKVKCNCMIY